MKTVARFRAMGAVAIFLTTILSAFAADREPDASTPDGGRYYGPLADGKLHGYGRLEWSNGARYEGMFKSGQLAGTGKLYFANADYYEGDFRAGLMHGRGEMKWRDGSSYAGEFAHDLMHGKGRYEDNEGRVYEGQFAAGDFHGVGKYMDTDSTYIGDFKLGRYAGNGEQSFHDGRRYVGAFVNGEFHGRGRYLTSDGQIYEGEFERGTFTGAGTYSRPDGTRHEGSFRKWRPHGRGHFTDKDGNVYDGLFVDGALNGRARFVGKDGRVYDGEFKNWNFHGRGLLRLANGDVYDGGFTYGLYEGEGTLRFAKPRNGIAEETGTWRYGVRKDDEQQRRVQENLEHAFYNQRRLLEQTLSTLAPSKPNIINAYFIGIAGDGTQRVFRREAEFVYEQFNRQFDTHGRSLTLVNSRDTLASTPIATITSIAESLRAIAARMDTNKDILFLFVTSHGDKDHQLSLKLDGVDLPPLSAKRLRELLDDAGISWRVLIISACYSGGFIEPLKDERSMIITAARHDRRSFGCADENDFTYFGRAFFELALPKSDSFQDAFTRAAGLIQTWETKADKISGHKKTRDQLSLPQMYAGPDIEKHLQTWWTQQRPYTH